MCLEDQIVIQALHIQVSPGKRVRRIQSRENPAGWHVLSHLHDRCDGKRFTGMLGFPWVLEPRVVSRQPFYLQRRKAQTLQKKLYPTRTAIRNNINQSEVNATNIGDPDDLLRQRHGELELNLPWEISSDTVYYSKTKRTRCSTFVSRTSPTNFQVLFVPCSSCFICSNLQGTLIRSRS